MGQESVAVGQRPRAASEQPGPSRCRTGRFRQRTDTECPDPRPARAAPHAPVGRYRTADIAQCRTRPAIITQRVACHGHGTTLSGFLPRGWDHPVASDGTTRRVVPVVLVTCPVRMPQVVGLGGSGDGVPGGGVIEIREVLRSWLAGAGLRTVAAQAGVDRKTARRYVEAAVAAGLARDGGAGQLTDELVGQVAEAVRPARPGGHGAGVGGAGGLPGADPGVGQAGPDGRQDRGAAGAAGGRGAVPDAAPVLRRALRVRPFGGAPRCGSPMASRGWSASWTSATWA